MKYKVYAESPPVQLKSFKAIEDVEFQNKPPEMECGLSNGFQSEDEYEIDPPDGGYGWVILGCVSYIFFTAMGCIAVTGIFLVEFEEYFQVSTTYASAIGATEIGSVAVLAPFVAVTIRKIGCKAVIIIGMTICQIASIIVFLTPRVEVLFLTYFMIGVGGCSLYITADIILQQYFNKKRSLANGIAVTASAAAVFVWPPLTRTLIDTYGWRGAVLVTAAIHAHVFPAALLLRAAPKKLKHRRNNSTEITSITDRNANIKDFNIENEQTQSSTQMEIFTVSQSATGHNLNNLNTEEQPCRHKSLSQHNRQIPRYYVWIVSAVMFVSWYGIRAGDTAVLTHFPVRAQLMDFTKHEAALLLSIQGAAQTLMCIPWGFIGDIRGISETGLISFGSVLCGASTCLSLIFKSFDMMVIHCVLFGIGAAALNTLGSSSVVEIFGINRVEQGIALLFSSYGLANSSAPLIAGFMYDEYGVFWPVLTFGIFQLVGGAQLLSAIYFKHRADNNPS